MVTSVEIINTNQNHAPINSTWKDWLGIVASIGCAIHCAAMPFVIAYLPSLGLSFLADESFHQWMALACFLIAMFAFVPGLFKHGSWVPVATGGVGLLLITVAAFGLTGDCCAGCSDDQATSSTTETSAVSETGESCCEEECEECAANETAEGTLDTDISTDSTSDWTSFITPWAPWVTPVGGVLLVAAHLLNRRFGYQCGCCESDPDTNGESSP